MVGTIVNTICIIGGSIIGATLKKGINPRCRAGLYDAMGLCALVIGIKDCKTLNLLPALLIPIVFFLGKSLLGI